MQFILNKKDNTVYSIDKEGVIFNFSNVTEDATSYIFRYFGHYIGFIEKRHIKEIIENKGVCVQ